MSTNGALVAMLAGLASLGSRRRGMTDIDVVERRPFFHLAETRHPRQKRRRTETRQYPGAKLRRRAAEGRIGINLRGY